MAMTLAELAKHVGGTVVGDGATEICGVMTIAEAGPGDITFLSNPKYEKMLAETKASAIIVSPKHAKVPKPLIVCDNPYLAFAQIVKLMLDNVPYAAKGIHPTALISPSAKIGRDATIHPYVVIGDNTRIGDRVTIYPFSFIGDHCTLGDDVVIHANVSVYHGTQIGSRVAIHSNASIGSDGFGWAPDGEKYYKIPQVGITVIEDDVSIGSGCSINRAALGKTSIRKGSKLDCLVQIGHNVDVGENSILVAQTGVSGSSKLGKHVTLAGQVGIVGHITVGDNVVVGAQAGVTNDIPPNETYYWTPAIPGDLARRCAVLLHKLPETRDTIKDLLARVEALEKKLGGEKKD
jgi:UDP-3-O-[3-hydroxymyristoyl] glucosamine N-acyltransferase